MLDPRSVAGCYDINWDSIQFGTWDAPLPKWIRLTATPVDSANPKARFIYWAEARYHYLEPPAVAEDYSYRPMWRVLGPDSIEIDLSGPGGRWREVLRARAATRYLVGAFGLNRRMARGFFPGIAFTAPRGQCSASVPSN